MRYPNQENLTFSRDINIYVYIYSERLREREETGCFTVGVRNSEGAIMKRIRATMRDRGHNTRNNSRAREEIQYI